MSKPLVVIATDLSKESEAALREGSTIARALGAKVVLFHSYDPLPAVPPGAIPEPARFEASIEREIVASIEQSMAVMRAKYLGELDDVHTQVERATTPAEAVCRYADLHKAELIVVATHGRTGLKHMLIGSVAERIVRHAPCSVLVAR